jgi:hypothetical protein
MRQGGKELRLALESRHALAVRGELGGQDLDRDIAREPGVSGAVDFSHRARPER